MKRRNNLVFDSIKKALVEMIELGIPVKIIADRLGYTHNHLSSIMTRNDCSALEIRREYKAANQIVNMKVTGTMKEQWQAKASAQGKTLSGWIKELCNA